MNLYHKVLSASSNEARLSLNLEEVVTRVGRRHFHEVQPNRAPRVSCTPCPSPCAVGASVFGLDALAGRASADEGVHVSCKGGPPHRAASQRQCFVPPKMPAEGSSVKFR